jgi:FKBP-type peptidyl-prolyl cis-trans isomerase
LYDKLWIIVPADQAYGKKGYLDLVDPNESMFYDLFIAEVDGKD